MFSISHLFALSLNIKVHNLNVKLLSLTYHSLPLRAKVNLEAILKKGYSAFPKASVLLEPHDQIVYRNIHYLSVEMQSVYSTVPILKRLR